MDDATAKILDEFSQEMDRQVAIWGDQRNLPNSTGPDFLLYNLPVTGCCSACKGTGESHHPESNGACWDCYGTGHVHPGTEKSCNSVRASDFAKWAKDRCKNAHHEIGTDTWERIFLEEVMEAIAENDPSKLRAELVQVGAVVATWIKSIDRVATNHD